MLATHSDWHPDNVSDSRDIPPSTLVLAMDSQLQADVPTEPIVLIVTSVIFVNENENGEKRENNEFVNKN